MNDHAVVVGGGIGGLLAARALARRFRRVTLLERYRYPSDLGAGSPPARRGVPQSRCLHLLMAAGAAAFDEVAPGWRDAALAKGALPFDASADAVTRFPGGWLPRVPSGIQSYACSRALLERVLQEGLAGTGVQIRESCKVIGLMVDPGAPRVRGVRTTGRHGSSPADVAADLVVDASGRGSVLPGWLNRSRAVGGGVEDAVVEKTVVEETVVEETVVDSPWQYVSRWYGLDEGNAPDWHCLSIAPRSGPSPCSAMMLRAERGRWGVVLLAPLGEPLPDDDSAFLAFAAKVGDGELWNALIHAEPLSPIHRYGATANRLRHFDRLPDWPAGLVALGDAVCALDPYFGLGMTVTARGVALLARCLDEAGADGALEARAFQRALAAQNRQPWELATGLDPDGGALLRDRDALSRLVEVAPTSPSAAVALLEIQHLLRSEGELTEVAHP